MTQPTRLSNREAQVVKLLLQGKSNKLIGLALGISDRTVEFHLKNIYAKLEVSSRIELVLKLGNTPGMLESRELGVSTVARTGKNAENRDRPHPRTDRVTSLKENVSTLGKELEMKNLLNTMHVPVGVVTALFTGFVWVAMFRYIVHMALDEIKPWVVPLILVWAVSGLAIGLVGKRNGNSSLKVWFGTLVGTGFSPFTILPLMGFVVLPAGKLAEAFGLIDRASISSEAATTIAISAMLGIWLVVAVAIGSMLLFLSIKKPEVQRQASEHGL